MSQEDQVIKAEIESIAKPYMNQLAKIETVMTNARGMAASLAECRRLTASVEMQRQQLDHKLNTFLLQANHDISKRRLYLPMISNQLDRIQDRIDMFSSKLMELMDDYSEAGFQKQNLLLDFIERQNNSFQQLTLRLMQ